MTRDLGTKPFDMSEKHKISEIAEILKGIFSGVRFKLANEIEIRFEKLKFIKNSESLCHVTYGRYVKQIPVESCLW